MRDHDDDLCQNLKKHVKCVLLLLLLLLTCGVKKMQCQIMIYGGKREFKFIPLNRQ